MSIPVARRMAVVIRTVTTKAMTYLMVAALGSGFRGHVANGDNQPDRDHDQEERQPPEKVAVGEEATADAAYFEQQKADQARSCQRPISIGVSGKMERQFTHPYPVPEGYEQEHQNGVRR